MPFYDYKCSDKECNHFQNSVLKKFTDKVINCPECGKDTSEQQFSGLFAAHGLPNGHTAVRVNREGK